LQGCFGLLGGAEQMRKVFWCVMLALLSSVAWADSSNTIPVTNFTSYNIPKTDLSMRYLGEMFGTVSSILPGHGSQLMGKLFYALNEGILVVAAMWLGYTIFNIFLSAALDGGFNNPQKKSALIFLRLALGFALLVPNPNTGYSGFQDVIMKVVVEGVRLADVTWDYALQYLQNGGSFFVASSKTAMGVTDVDAYMARTNAKSPDSNGGPIENIYMDEVCMALSNDYMTNNTGSDDPNVTASENAPFHIVYNTDGKTIDFPGYGDEPPYVSGSNHCGSVAAYQVRGGSATHRQVLNGLSFSALSQAANDLLPIATRQAYNVTHPNDVPVTESSLDGSAFYQSVIDYTSLIKPLAESAVSGSPNTQVFWKNAADDGWFDAGRYYWNLASSNDEMNAPISYAGYVPSATLFDGGNFPDVLSDHLGAAYGNVFGPQGPKGNTASIFSQAKTLLNNYITAGQATNASGSVTGVATQASGSAVSDPSFSSAAVLLPAVEGGMQMVAQTFFNLEQKTSSGFYDPLYFMLHLGKTCLKAAGHIWASGAEAVGVSAGFAGICSAINPGATVLSSMMSWMQPVMIMSGLGLFVAGFMMTFYAPLYPYVLFMFGAIGWILFVIESMVAAPLVCFGLTHPEGHDFLGRSEQALMLALGVFLRPVLMVIGFLAGLMLTYVSFSIVNYGFSGVLSEIFIADPSSAAAGANVSVMNAAWGVVTGDPSGNTSQGSLFSGYQVVDMLIVVLLLIFYGFIVIEVVNQCFSLIHQLPDMVLRWIGGPAQQDRTEQSAQKLGSQVGGAAKQVGEIGGSAAIHQATAKGSAHADSAGIGIGGARLMS
jgi:defect in organelle trafficking protein DotA